MRRTCLHFNNAYMYPFFDTIPGPAFGMCRRTTRYHTLHTHQDQRDIATALRLTQRKSRLDGNIISFCKATAICTGTEYQNPPFTPCSQRVYNKPDPSHPTFPTRRRKRRTHETAQCETSKLPTKRMSYTFSVSMVSRTFWTLFLLFFPFPSNPILPFCCSEEERLISLREAFHI